MSTSPRMATSLTISNSISKTSLVRVPKRTYLPCLTYSIPRVDDWELDKITRLILRVVKVREEHDWLKDMIRLYMDSLQSVEAVLQSTKAKLLTAEAKLDALRDILHESKDGDVGTDSASDSDDYLDSDREDAHDEDGKVTHEAPIGVCQHVPITGLV